METNGNDVQRETSDQAIPEVVRKLLADVSATVFIIGNDFRPSWCSSPDGRLFGRDTNTWGPGTLGDCLHPADQVWLKRKRHEILEDPGLTVQGLIRVRFPDGEYSSFMLTAVNRFDDPDVNGLIITATPAHQTLPDSLEGQDVQRARALGRQNELLETLHTQLQAALSAISVSTNAISDHPGVGPTHGTHVATIDSATQTLRGLIDDIVGLSKITSGTIELESVVFSPSRLLNNLTTAFEPVCKSKDLELELRLDPGLPARVKGDPARLEQVIHHLISNAIGSATGDVVLVEAAPVEDSRVQFRISNSVGANAACVADSLSPTRQQPSDAEIRLSIAREIVELMDGSFGCETSDRATVVWFDIVLGHARRIEDHSSGPEAAPTKPPATAHVLVVDDSDVNRLLATSQLERLGHSSSTADSGPAALDALTNETFDVVLMDWHMPGMDGLEATRRWRAEHDPDRVLPIITMTASAMAGDRERCLDAGASDYLSKPVSINDLGTMITRWTQRASPDSANNEAPDHAQADSALALDAEPPSYDQSRVSALINDLGDLAVVRSIVRAFLEMVPQYRATAEEALVEDDRSTIRRCAHTLKSTALMLGTHELAESCILLEAAAATDEASHLTVPVADFARCCHRAEVTLADLAAQLDTANSPQP